MIAPALAQAPTAPLMSLAQAAALLPDALRLGDPATALLRVHSDTRSLQPGDLFVALRGEQFDAHDFLPQARAAGAAAVLAERGVAACGLPGLQVADSGAALQALARGWRAGLSLPVIAVTGSNGKTTVTQMVAAILRAWQGDAALATAGNFNNHIGLPLQLLRLRASHRVAVLELGMNHPGEIAGLSALAQAGVALVNNAQREHQEFMASVDAVAAENGAVLAALPADGVAVFPADAEHTPLWQALAGARRQWRFALRPAAGVPAEVQGDAEWHSDAAGGHWQLQMQTPAGPASLRLAAPGEHNLRNALAATASALAAGAPLAAVVAGLQCFRPVSGRNQISALAWPGHGPARPVTLVDDSYNANPDSVRAAISLLAGLAGPRWLLLGDMGEVGDQGPAFHAEVGAFARSSGIEHFWAVGAGCAAAASAYGSRARHWATVDGLIAALDRAPDFGSVLVKGSRFMRMERVVAGLQALAGRQPAGGDHAA